MAKPDGIAQEDLQACRERRQEPQLTPACVEQSGSLRVSACQARRSQSSSDGGADPRSCFSEGQESDADQPSVLLAAEAALRPVTTALAASPRCFRAAC
jgi:hypothetical protein